MFDLHSHHWVDLNSSVEELMVLKKSAKSWEHQMETPGSRPSLGVREGGAYAGGGSSRSLRISNVLCWLWLCGGSSLFCVLYVSVVHI